ncbi:4-hydroxythreonine-4-phosphate dehydrogenase [Marinibacterium profundimaris]|uniref:4-hydroxythreonine-4-phosphate dehydrogenase n=2 Tax=Marinibacterium profundimaris TaxID=1679460 RepID=A0A225NSF9_9RHOB|nr:4-hydroxythreonine-4-phosphate dehydrogenase [Marinibacterium profundimaris]
MLPPVLSCGDPAGIGPELAAKAWDQLRADLPFAWIGDPAHLPEGTPVTLIDTPAEAAAVASDTLPVLAHRFPAPATPGQPDPANAPAVIEVLDRAVDLVMSGAAGALCTAPINKKVLIDGAAFAHPGHTEYLAARAGVDRVVMMLAGPDLRVVPATIHIALSDVPRALTPALLRETIEITARDLKDRFGLPAPRIAVSGLNPHAGEGGAMGHEELDWIAGLIAEMAAEGHAVTGPHPADTMFHAAARARYDVAIAMYHDQALIPIKTLDFDRGVNVTLGLPFIRTSPDHGTAYDIAGQGIAAPTSLVEALKLADRLSRT